MATETEKPSDEEMDELFRYHAKKLKESKLGAAEHELLAMLTSAQLAAAAAGGKLKRDEAIGIVADAYDRGDVTSKQYNDVWREVAKFWDEI
jgi:hypothetical protein